MDAIWNGIDAAEMPEAGRILLFDQAAVALRGHMADLLRAGHTSESPSDLVDQVSGGVIDLVAHVDELLAEEARDHPAAIAASYAGAPACRATPALPRSR